MTLLSELMDKQQQLTYKLTMLECGITDFDFEREDHDVKSTLKDFLTVDKLTDTLVNSLIERIDVGYVVTSDEGLRRDISITYTFEKITE